MVKRGEDKTCTYKGTKVRRNVEKIGLILTNELTYGETLRR